MGGHESTKSLSASSSSSESSTIGRVIRTPVSSFFLGFYGFIIISPLGWDDTSSLCCGSLSFLGEGILSLARGAEVLGLIFSAYWEKTSTSWAAGWFQVEPGQGPPLPPRIDCAEATISSCFLICSCCYLRRLFSRLLNEAPPPSSSLHFLISSIIFSWFIYSRSSWSCLSCSAIFYSSSFYCLSWCSISRVLLSCFSICLMKRRQRTQPLLQAFLARFWIRNLPNAKSCLSEAWKKSVLNDLQRGRQSALRNLEHQCLHYTQAEF